MMLYLYTALFVGCAAGLYFAGEWIVSGLSRLSRIFGVREFVLAFFIMATAASLPNLFIGLSAVAENIPELSLGDIFGNNLIALTLAVAIAIFFAPKQRLATRTRTIRTSLGFTAAAAVLPVALLADGTLTRIDGGILIGFFCMYAWWLLAREPHFSKIYRLHPTHGGLLHDMRASLVDGLKIVAGVSLLLLSAFGIVSSAEFFAGHFNVPVLVIGLLITGLGGALPEIYFAAMAARRGGDELVMGNLMGAIIVPATLVLGLITLLHPIQIADPGFLAASRSFLIVAAGLFFVFATSGRRIARAEGIALFLLYVLFVVATIATV